MLKRVLFTMVAFSTVLILTAPSFAAYEFYILKLSTKAKVMDWKSVEKSARSVPGVEKVEVNKGNNTISVFCKEKCTNQIQEGVEGKLQTKGVQGQKVGGIQKVSGRDFPKVETKKSPAGKIR